METKIRLDTIENVKEFVSLSNECDFDVDIFYNRVIIDAKSILGVLSMDLTQVMTVRCYGDGSDFFSQIEKFAPQNAVA